MITDLMLNEDLHPSEAVDFLEDLENACKKDGVSLPELLTEEMSTGGVPPLMWEIQRCNWREEPELLLFLLTRTPSPKVPWMIRTACQAVGDNELLQLLRETLEPDVSCQALPSNNSEFGVCITVKGLSQKLRHQSDVTVEWIVEERAWALKLKADILDLTLLDGPPTVFTAEIHVDPWNTAELTLLDEPSTMATASMHAGLSDQKSSVHSSPGTALLPIGRAGRNSVKWKANWRPGTWGNNIPETRTSVSFQVKVNLKQVLEASGQSGEEEKTEKSALEEDDDWVLEYGNEKPAVEEKDGSGWILASWAGKDKDLDESDEGR